MAAVKNCDRMIEFWSDKKRWRPSAPCLFRGAGRAGPTIRGYGVDVRGYCVDVRDCGVDVRGYGVD
eukprot:4453008-Pyramimonas_sp.AAC.1